MSLEGAQFICLDEDDNRGEIVVAKGREFTVGYYVSCDFVLTDDRAKGIHCTIECDAFGRITIRNMSPEHPVLVNGATVENKRNLFNKSIISILDKRYIWELSSHSAVDKEDAPTDDVSTPKKQIGIPEQTGFSSPGIKTKKNASRFTVHTFAYCIQSDEDGNVSIDSNKNNESSENIGEEKEEKSKELLQESSEKSTQQPERQVTPEPESGNTSTASVQRTPKMNLLNCTNNKENTGSTQKKHRLELSMCHQSEVVITSFSPRQTGTRTEKSFTAILMPKVLVTRAPNTPKSVYSTPKSLLGDDDDDEIDRSRYINFHTPSTSKKPLCGANTATKSLKNSSMHLVDYTTPKRLAPVSPYLKSALKASAKKLPLTSTTEKISKNTTASEDQLGVSVLPFTPVVSDDNKNKAETPNSVQSVISVNSTDTSSVIEILSDESTPGLSAVKTPQKTETTKVQSNTPMRTPQSLMKRAILTNRSKQLTPQRGPDNVQTTPRRDPINRIPLRSSIGALRSPITPRPTFSDVNTNRRQSISTPSRKSMAAPSAPRFESTPNSNTKFATPPPARRSLMAKSASKTVSTPLGTGSYNRHFACNTSPLNRVRKSFAGVPLSNHISKARKSIIAAAPSNFTSIKEKSPQQKMSDKILYRARNSAGVTPMIARAIKMVHASKDTPSILLKQSITHRKSMTSSRAVLFADKQAKEQTIDRSLTFILDSDDEESNANKIKNKVEGKESKSKSNEDSKHKEIDSPVEKEQIINLTFSPRKEKETQQAENLPTTEETPVDVDEVPPGVEEALDEDSPESLNPQGNISTIEVSEDSDEGEDDEDVIHVPLTSQATEESFAEEILVSQRGELQQTNDSSESAAPTEVLELESEKIETGFGEEPEASTNEEVGDTVNSEIKNLSKSDAAQSHDALDISSQVYKPIYEDITLESSVIEKEVKDLSLSELSKNLTLESSLIKGETQKNSKESVCPKDNVIEGESTADNENNSGLTCNAPTEQDFHKFQEKDKDVLVPSTDKDNLKRVSPTALGSDKSKETTREIADVLEEKGHLATEESAEVVADKSTTSKLLEEIEEVLNNSDELELKHSTGPYDNKSNPIPTEAIDNKKLTQESNSRFKENKAEDPSQKINLESEEETKNTPEINEIEAVPDSRNESKIEEQISMSTNEDFCQESHLQCEQIKETEAASVRKNETEREELISKSSESIEELSQEINLECKIKKSVYSDSKTDDCYIKESISKSTTNKKLIQEDCEETKYTEPASENDDILFVPDTENENEFKDSVATSPVNEELRQEIGFECEDNKGTQATSEKEAAYDSEKASDIVKSTSKEAVNDELCQESILKTDDTLEEDGSQAVSDTNNESKTKISLLTSHANEYLSQENESKFEKNEDKQEASDCINDSELEELMPLYPADEDLSQEINLDSKQRKDNRTASQRDVTQFVSDINNEIEFKKTVSMSRANETLCQERVLDFDDSKDNETTTEKDDTQIVSDTSNENEFKETIRTSHGNEYLSQDSNLAFEENEDKQAALDSKADSDIIPTVPTSSDQNQKSYLDCEKSKDTQTASHNDVTQLASDTNNETEVNEPMSTFHANEFLEHKTDLDFVENEEIQGASECPNDNEIDESISTSTATLECEENRNYQAATEKDGDQVASGTNKDSDIDELILTSPPTNEELSQGKEKDVIEADSYTKQKSEIEDSESKSPAKDGLSSHGGNMESEKNKEGQEKVGIQVSDSKNEVEIEESIKASSANEEQGVKNNLKSKYTKGIPGSPDNSNQRAITEISSETPENINQTQISNLELEEGKTQDDKKQGSEVKSTSEINTDCATDSEGPKEDDHLPETNNSNPPGHKLLEIVKAANSPRRISGRRSVAADSVGDTKSKMEISTATTHTADVEKEFTEALTPRRASRRKSISAQLEASSVKTPVKSLIETEAESSLTPRRSSRRKSISDETLTPRRNTRRASMTTDITAAYTPTTTNTKTRRASLSAVSEMPLTPKRISRRRSSISMDTDESIKVAQEKNQLSDETTGIIFEETKEDMGAIIEEEEEALHCEETTVDETETLCTKLETSNNKAAVENKVIIKERGDVKVVTEENLRNVIGQDCDTRKEEQHTENVQTTEKPIGTVQDLKQIQEDGEVVASKSNQDPINETTNETAVIDSEQVLIQDEEDICEVGGKNEFECDTTQDEENMAVVVDVSVQALTEYENIVHSRNDVQDVTSVQNETQASEHNLTLGEGDVGEVVNVSLQDTRDNDSTSHASVNKSVQDLTKEEVAIESEIDLTKDEGEPTQSVHGDATVTVEEDMETLEVSDDESIYDYGKEVQAPVTPKAKKYKRSIAGTPKTPIMTGLRNLLKTPKLELNTPKLGEIRHLVHTPKLKDQETEEEENEKLQSMQVIVKTPNIVQPEEARKAASSQDTEKGLRGVKELLKTPKSCATPRFKGMRELMQTPKLRSTPILGGVKELLDTPQQSHELQLDNVEVANDDRENDKSGVKDVEDVEDVEEIEKDNKEHSLTAPTEAEMDIQLKDLIQTPEPTELLNTTKLVKDIKEVEKEIAMTSQKGSTDSREAKDLTSTPKSCATPRFKGIRELMKTPKISSTPLLCGVKELFDAPEKEQNIQLEDVTELKKNNQMQPTTTDVDSTHLLGNKHKELLQTPTQKPDDEGEIVTNQSICEVDCKGVKELLKTPKGCSTPRFKGIRELMKTPKMCSTPALGGIKELMNTPKQDKSNFDKFLKTPTAKNIMIPTLPSSAVIEKREDSVEMTHSIEYNLNDSHEGSSDNLGELFKTPVASRFVDRLSISYDDDDHGQDYEEAGTSEKEAKLHPDIPTNSKQITENLQTPSRKVCHRKSLLLETPLAESPFSAADVLTDMSRTEIEDWVDKIDPLEQTINLNDDDNVDEDKDKDNPREDSKVIILDDSIANDSLSVVPETCVKVLPANESTSSEAMMNISTVHNTTSKDPLGRSTAGNSKQNDKRPITPSETADISGIDLLDETTESVLEISLIVSDDNEEENSAEYNKSLIDTCKPDDTLCEEGDNDLSEPLLLSDNEPASTEETIEIDISRNILEQGQIEPLSSITPNVEEDSLSNKNNKNRESEDIFLNDTLTEGETTIESEKDIAADFKARSEAMLDESKLVESSVEKETGKVSSPKECEDIFMEDSVCEITASIEDTNNDVADIHVRIENEDIQFASIEIVGAPNNRNDTDKEEISPEGGNQIDSADTLDKSEYSKVLNENVSSPSQEESSLQTSSTNVICQDKTNNDNDGAQTEIKALVATEISTEIEYKNDAVSEEVISISESTTSEEVVQSEESDETKEQSSEFNRNDNSEMSGDVISIDDSSCEEVPEGTSKGVVAIEIVGENKTTASTTPDESSDVNILINTETNLELPSNNEVSEEASDVVSLLSPEKILKCKEEIMGESKNLYESSEVPTIIIKIDETTLINIDETTLISDDKSSSSHDTFKIDPTIKQNDSKTLALTDSFKVDPITEDVESSSDAFLLPSQHEPDAKNVVAKETEVADVSENKKGKTTLGEELMQKESDDAKIVSKDILKPKKQSTIEAEKSNISATKEAGFETSLNDIQSCGINSDDDNVEETSEQEQITKDKCETENVAAQMTEATEEVAVEPKIIEVGSNQTNPLLSEAIKPDIKSTSETKEEAKTCTTENISLEETVTDESSSFSKYNNSKAQTIEDTENIKNISQALQPEDIQMEGNVTQSQYQASSNDNEELQDTSMSLITETDKEYDIKEKIDAASEIVIESEICDNDKSMSSDESSKSDKSASKISEKQDVTENTAAEINLSSTDTKESYSETAESQSDKIITKSEEEKGEHCNNQELGVVNTVQNQSQSEGIEMENEAKKSDANCSSNEKHKFQTIPESTILETFKSYDIEVKIREVSESFKGDSAGTNIAPSESDVPPRQDKTTKRTQVRKASQTSKCSNDSDLEAPKTRRKRRNTKTEHVTPQPENTLHTVEEIENTEEKKNPMVVKILESEESENKSNADTLYQESKTSIEKLEDEFKDEDREKAKSGISDVLLMKNVHKLSENKSDTQTEVSQDPVHEINLKVTKPEKTGNRKVQFTEETPKTSSTVKNVAIDPSQPSDDHEDIKTTEERESAVHINVKDTEISEVKTTEAAKRTHQNRRQVENNSSETSDIYNENVAEVIQNESVQDADNGSREVDNTIQGSVKRNRRKPSRTENKQDEATSLEEAIEESDLRAKKSENQETPKIAETLSHNKLEENCKSRPYKGSQDAPGVKIIRGRAHSTAEKESNVISQEETGEPKLAVTVQNSENTETVEGDSTVQVKEEPKPASKRTRRKASCDSMQEDDKATHSRKASRRKGAEDKELGVIKELDAIKSTDNSELEESEKLSEITEQPTGTTKTKDDFSKVASKITKETLVVHTRMRRRLSQDSENEFGSKHTRKASCEKGHLGDKSAAVLDTIIENEKISKVPGKEHKEEQEITQENKQIETHIDQKALETIEEDKLIDNIAEDTALTTTEVDKYDLNESTDPVQVSRHRKTSPDPTTHDKASENRKTGRKKVRNEMEKGEGATIALTSEEQTRNLNKSKKPSDVTKSQAPDKTTHPTTTSRIRRIASHTDQLPCTTKSRGRHPKVEKTTADEEAGTLSKVEEDTQIDLTDSHVLENLTEKQLVAEEEAILSHEATEEDNKVKNLENVKYMQSDNKDQIIEIAGTSNVTNEQRKGSEPPETKKHNPIAKRGRRKASQDTTHDEDSNNQHSKRGRRIVAEPELPVMEEEALSSRSRSRNHKLIEEKKAAPNLEQEEEKVQTNAGKSESDNAKISDEDSKVDKNPEKNPAKKCIKRPVTTTDTTCDTAEPVTRRIRQEKESQATENDENTKEEFAAVSSDVKLELEEESEPDDKHQISKTSSDVKHGTKPRKPVTRRKAAAAHSTEKGQQDEKPVSRSRRGQKVPVDIDQVHHADQSDDQHGHDEKSSLKSRRGRKAYGKDELVKQSDHSQDQHGDDEKSSLRSRRCRKAHDGNFEEEKQGHDENPTSISRKGHKTTEGGECSTHDDLSEDQHSNDEIVSSKSSGPNLEDQRGHDDKSSLKSQADIKTHGENSSLKSQADIKPQDGNTEDLHVLDEKLPIRTRRGQYHHDHDEKPSISLRRGRKYGEEFDDQVHHKEDQHDHDEKPSGKSVKGNKAHKDDKNTNQNNHSKEELGHGEMSSTRPRRGRKAHDVEESANQDDHPEEESKSTRRAAVPKEEDRAPASRRRGAARKKVNQEKEHNANISSDDITPGTKESTKRNNRKQNDEPRGDASTIYEEPIDHLSSSQSLQAETKSHKQKDSSSDHDVSKSHTSTVSQTNQDANASHTKQDELNTTSEDSPNKRGRNVPQRKAATHHHSYDETSDSDKPEKRKKKAESPRKSIEAAKNIHLETIVSESSSVPSPTLSSSAVTARGRTRKPTARVQQFLEEERAKAETPKKRAALAAAVDTPTKGKPLRRGAKTVTDTEVIGTSQSYKQTRGRAAAVADDNKGHEEDEQTTSPTTAKGRKGSRKAKADVHTHSDDTEEPPAKKSPAELEAEKDKIISPKNEASTPTRVAGRRNAAAAAKFRIEEDAIATAAIDPPKKSRAKRQPAKAGSTPEKRDHRLVSASTLEEDDENPEHSANTVKEETKAGVKRGGTRRAASASTETADLSGVGLPSKKSRRGGKAATETHESDTESTAETKSSRSATTTRGGRRNVHFESTDLNSESAATAEPATTNKRATRVRRI